MTLSDPHGSLVVTGTGRASAVPDAAVLDLQLEGLGATVGEALDALTRATEAARAALPDHRLRTEGLGLYPRHDQANRQIGHTAYQTLHVRTEDPTEVGALVARLAEAVGSGLGVHGLRREVGDASAARAQARELAFARAREAAEHWARMAGRHLGEVRWLRESPGAGRPGVPEGARMVMASGPAVDPADEEVVAVVEVAWSLED